VKEIRIGSNMLVNHFKSGAIVGHSYPRVYIYFHEHVMNNIMVLRKVYALVPNLPMRGILSKGWIAWDRGCWELGR